MREVHRHLYAIPPLLPPSPSSRATAAAPPKRTEGEKGEKSPPSQRERGAKQPHPKRGDFLYFTLSLAPGLLSSLPLTPYPYPLPITHFPLLLTPFTPPPLLSASSSSLPLPSPPLPFTPVYLLYTFTSFTLYPLPSLNYKNIFGTSSLYLSTLLNLFTFFLFSFYMFYLFVF